MEASRRRTDGWIVESIPKGCGFFFCNRDNERVCVSIECFEPGAVGGGRWPRRR